MFFFLDHYDTQRVFISEMLFSPLLQQFLDSGIKAENNPFSLKSVETIINKFRDLDKKGSGLLTLKLLKNYQ